MGIAATGAGVAGASAAVSSASSPTCSGREMRNVAPSPGALSTLARPAVRFGDRGDDRQAEPGAAARARARRVGAPEPLEHALGVGLRHAGALVGDLDDRVVAVGADRARASGVSGGVCRFAFCKQVGEHLAQPGVVAGHDDRRRSAVKSTGRSGATVRRSSTASRGDAASGRPGCVRAAGPGRGARAASRSSTSTPMRSASSSMRRIALARSSGRSAAPRRNSSA